MSDTRKETEKQVLDRISEEEKKIASNDGQPEIESRFVLDCLRANRLGDGILYGRLLSDKLIYNKTIGEWFAYLGHYWKRDIMEVALCKVEVLNILALLVPIRSSLTP